MVVIIDVYLNIVVAEIIGQVNAAVVSGIIHAAGI